jgi:hypothetical protein
MTLQASCSVVNFKMVLDRTANARFGPLRPRAQPPPPTTEAGWATKRASPAAWNTRLRRRAARPWRARVAAGRLLRHERRHCYAAVCEVLSAPELSKQDMALEIESTISVLRQMAAFEGLKIDGPPAVVLRPCAALCRAEQASLGSLLSNKARAADRCQFLKPERFADRVNGRISLESTGRKGLKDDPRSPESRV